MGNSKALEKSQRSVSEVCESWRYLDVLLQLQIHKSSLFVELLFCNWGIWVFLLFKKFKYATI